MIWRVGAIKILLCAACFLVAIQFPQSRSYGGWFTRLVDKASDAGGGGAGRKTGRSARAVDLGEAGAFVTKLPQGSRGHAVAASVSDDGHWHLMNGAGERVTVSGSDELEDAMKWLVSDGFNKDRRLITFYIRDDGIVRNPEYIKILPSVAQRVIVSRGKKYPVFFKRIKGEDVFFANLREGVDVRLGGVDNFREVVWQMEKPLNRGDVRLLSLHQNGAKELPQTGIVGSGGLPQPDQVDPYFLKSALSSLKGQTVLVTGRVKDDLLYFQPSGGSDLSIFLADIVKAARASDIRLIVLDTGQSRQPGGRDWLWRKVGIKGLEDGLMKLNFGDFLDTVGRSRGGFEVQISDRGGAHLKLSAGPRVVPRGVLEHDNGPDYDGLGSALTDVMAAIKGDMVVATVMTSMPSSARQKELDDRIIPGIPSVWQHFYLGSIILGLIGFPVAQRWWYKLWPPEDHGEYRTRIALGGAVTIRWILFVLVFLPIVGVAAFFVNLDGLARRIIMAPYYWIAGRKA